MELKYKIKKKKKKKKKEEEEIPEAQLKIRYTMKFFLMSVLC